jgi:hypothetical protein
MSKMDKEFLIETLYDDDGNSTYALHRTIGNSVSSICHGISSKERAEWLLEACRWKASADEGLLSLPSPTKGIKLIPKRLKKKKKANE